MTHKYLAHLQNAKGDLHFLDEHLKCVGRLAEEYISHADPQLAEIAKWAGMLHDLGKYRDEFQQYLLGDRDSSKETHHAVYGAALAFRKASETRNECWIPIAFAVLAYHTGLHNKSDLPARFQQYDAFTHLPDLTKKFELEVEKLSDNIAGGDMLNNPLRMEFAIRMIFSALVDADRYDTAFHANNWQNPEKIEFAPTLLLEQLDIFRRQKSQDAEKNGADKKLIDLRNKIFDDCVKKARLKSGFFSLTVPTGGGKTLNSMAGALKHAEIYGKRRVIVVIPFLSIIEQNAKVYREIFGDEVVVENHSAIEINEDQDDRDDMNRLSLVTENWDAPIIVTTSVQFIESLFSNKTSRCRKLHNIANSVVIFDEIQTLPAKLLEPLFNILRELVENYSVSFIFSTATQPAFRKDEFNFTQGLDESELIPITEDTSAIYEALNRVSYEFKTFQTPRTWDDIAADMSVEKQIMCILNTRRHAFELWDELFGRFDGNDKAGLFHLSSAMCAEHRLQTIEAVKQRLKSGDICRVVSTQLVEAGVDLDFPVVYRAVGPLDSIVQAAGRCNREGKLEKGRVVVFTPADNSIPPGVYQAATDETCKLLSNYTEEDLGSDHEIFAEYFSRLYSRLDTGKEIQASRSQLNFKDVASAAKVIDNEGIGVIVPFGKAKTIIDKIRAKNFRSEVLVFNRKDLRSLQRFMVNLNRRDFEYLLTAEQLQPLIQNKGLDLFVVNEGSYHEYLGVVTNNRPTNEFYVV